MVWVDYLIISIIVISSLISIFRGFTREVLSLLSWILAFWVAFVYAPNLSTLFIPYIETPSIRHYSAILILFLATLLLATLVNHLLSKLVEKTGLTSTDRTLGVLFGMLRGIVIVTFLVLLAGTTLMPNDAWWQNSLLLEHFEKLANWVKDLLPDLLGALSRTTTV